MAFKIPRPLLIILGDPWDQLSVHSTSMLSLGSCSSEPAMATAGRERQGQQDPALGMWMGVKGETPLYLKGKMIRMKTIPL